MSTHKPAEEYYLHDHGDGNGWQVASKGPGKFGLITTGSVKTHDDGLIEACHLLVSSATFQVKH